MPEPVPERTPPDVVTVNADDLRAVLNQDCRHAHQDHGIWDDGNGEKSGTACRECAARDGLIAALDLARPMTTPPDDTTEGERLAKHLAGRHADGMALQRSLAENREAHQHEHDGPGTIRNHDRNDLDYDERSVQQVVDEMTEDEER